MSERMGDGRGDRPATGRWSWVVGVLLSMSAPACGGSTPPPDDASDPPVVADDPGSGAAAASSAKVQEGIDALQAEDFERARAILTEAHEADPKDAQAAFYLGVALEALGEADAAVTSYKKALENDAKLVEAWVNLSGVLLDAKKDLAGALAAADEGLKVAPTHAGLLLNRAVSLHESGGEGVLEAYAVAVKANADAVALRYSYAELLVAAGKADEAKAQLGQVKDAATDATLLAATAKMFGRLKAFDACISTLDKAIGAKPAADLHVRRGVCRHDGGDDPGAEKDYLKAIEIDAAFAPAHYYLGMHHCGLKKKKEGAAALEKAVKLAGDQGVGPNAKAALAKCK